MMSSLQFVPFDVADDGLFGVLRLALDDFEKMLGFLLD